MRWVGESSAHDPVPPGHVAAPDPYMVRGVRTGAGGPGPLWGSAASAVSSELPFLRVTWRHRTHPQAGYGPGRWPGEGKAWPVGPGYSVLPVQLRITTQVLPCCSRSGYPCYRVPTLVTAPNNISTIFSYTNFY